MNRRDFEVNLDHITFMTMQSLNVPTRRESDKFLELARGVKANLLAEFDRLKQFESQEPK